MPALFTALFHYFHYYTPLARRDAISCRHDVSAADDDAAAAFHIIIADAAAAMRMPRHAAARLSPYAF